MGRGIGLRYRLQTGSRSVISFNLIIFFDAHLITAEQVLPVRVVLVVVQRAMAAVPCPPA